ncbi:hypothetical protein X801_09286 [Opisthorchis viverrini]|uniref:Lanthionine synthetase C-like protein n=1 Tax=Opisthorchis viverrini TaxID=6198 RepID=A0A1S8WKE8_OPIVI|nr:hypothetical protein X801_09286 [Opisthorchis viverrini]
MDFHRSRAARIQPLQFDCSLTFSFVSVLIVLITVLGAIMAYARAYLLWKDERYLAECRRCAETVWQRGLLKKGPGICHGVAGSGYALLLMFRLTGELVYLHRAAMFATFMQSDTFRQARRPDCPHSLFEGLAGTACFFADLADPCKSGFPFMNPLWDVE